MNNYKSNGYIKIAINQRHISNIMCINKNIKTVTITKFSEKECYTFIVHPHNKFLRIKGKMLK